MMNDIEHLKDILLKRNYSCVIGKNDDIRTFSKRGVMDLYELLKNDPAFLNGASIADKVIGKGAAAILALGKIKEIYTPLISTPALLLLRKENIRCSFDQEVPYIKNRTQTGSCPLEARCKDEDNIKRLLPIIEQFINELNNK